MATVSFKKGLLANLPQSYTEGTFYVTTDERAIYLDVSGSQRVRLGDFQEFATLAALQANANPSTTALYYITELNVLAKWDGTQYAQINTDTGATSVEVNGSGNAVTAASYDEATRKLTLTMGESFATAAELESAKPEVHEITSDETDLEVVAAGITGKAGDVLVVTNSKGVKSAYAYDKDTGWIACDGNVDASKVILNKDITLAGNYTQVGNLTKTKTTTTGTFSVAGKSVEAALTEMLSKREQPKITANPAVSLTFNEAKAYEVGTSVTPAYSASLSAGSYTYGPATGITATSWEVNDNAGSAEQTSASGNFPALTVTDGMSYTITAVANYDAGAVAVDNLGDPSDPTVQIAAGSKSKTSSAITGYRSFFYGVLDTSSATALTSEMIRGLTNSNEAYGASKTFVVNATATAKRIVVAIPHSAISTTRTGVSEVLLTSAMSTPVTDSYTHTESAVMVADARGGENNMVAYDVWVYEPSAIDAGEVHQITLA